MPTFAELRAKAEAAARAPSLPSLPKPTKYEPSRPQYGQQQSFLSPAERAKQSTVLQYEQSKHVAPPPPRRLNSAASAASSEGLAPVGRAPPAPARKPAGLSTGGRSQAPPPPLPTRRDDTPAPPYAPSLPARGPSSPAPPYPASPPLASAPSPGLAPPPPLRRAPSSAVSAVASQLDRVVVRDEREEGRRGWKRFSEYDEGDKAEMFAALDLFFESRLPFSASSAPPAALSQAPYIPPTSPPAVALSTRPRLPASSSSSSASPQPFAPTPKPPELHAPSYPPHETHSSSALSLLHYILSAPFSSAWFVHTPGQSPLPPPLIRRSDVRSTCAWSSNGMGSNVGQGCVVFGDTSVLWYRLTWLTFSEQSGRAHLDVRREGRYRPRAGPLEADELYEASETYGPLICAWAERAEQAGAPVARGECWDLANEALASISSQHPDLPPPFPSIARTHGSLLFYANAARKNETGEVLGTWTGGDVYVRPGDVVEWRKVRIAEVGAARGGYSLLGDPDHTALILSAASPSSLPSLSSTLTDASYLLSSLVSLTVLEQSLGHAPRTASYDLAKLSEGEVWIYRPVAMERLAGLADLSPEWPKGRVESWAAGELE